MHIAGLNITITTLRESIKSLVAENVLEAFDSRLEIIFHGFKHQKIVAMLTAR